MNQVFTPVLGLGTSAAHSRLVQAKGGCGGIHFGVSGKGFSDAIGIKFFGRDGIAVPFPFFPYLKASSKPSQSWFWSASGLSSQPSSSYCGTSKAREGRGSLRQWPKSNPMMSLVQFGALPTFPHFSASF